MLQRTMKTLSIAIVGGGAGGFFSAIRCAEKARELNKKVSVTIYESSNSVLKKVRISGGGRCNVTHHIYDPKVLVNNYPRGQKELISPFYQFQPKDTVEWFLKRGIKIKHEDDGRMFPITDSSETIIDCFLNECKKFGVQIKTNHSVKNIETKGDQFQLNLATGETINADKVLIATGSSKIGYDLARQLGHKITELAPSLFTFKIKDSLLKDMSGISFKNAQLTLKMDGEKSYKQEGPLLITHWGLSGPALLKLSAWAARPMQRVNYKAKILVNWLGVQNPKQLEEQFFKIKNNHPKAQISNTPLEGIAKRFWQNILINLEIPLDKSWAEVSKKELNKLIQKIYGSELMITGKSRFKEEFVECGGVSLKEVDFKSMQSKVAKGLYFSGEILDIDGITGGFNFQNAWTTAWLAANDMVN